MLLQSPTKLILCLFYFCWPRNLNSEKSLFYILVWISFVRWKRCTQFLSFAQLSSFVSICSSVFDFLTKMAFVLWNKICSWLYQDSWSKYIFMSSIRISIWSQIIYELLLFKIIHTINGISKWFSPPHHPNVLTVGL